MTKHLLLVTIGPVQDFIVQARRTRDLWYGSHLLSELSRSVARSLHEHPGVTLIFPALGRKETNKTFAAQGPAARDLTVPEGLEACITPFYPPGHTKAGDVPVNVANIILTRVEGASDIEVEALARTARECLKKFWRDDIAKPIRGRCRGLIANETDEITDEVWTEQIETLPEFVATWAPLKQDESYYKEVRDELTAAIAGRKNLRDFSQWQKFRGGVPKSSLDGARETVLKEPKTRNKTLVRKYRIGEGEQLDAVGLVKRAGGEPEAAAKDPGNHDLQFVPLANVALAKWLELARTTFKKEFEAAVNAAKAAGWSRVRRDIPCGGNNCSCDAQVFFESRWWPGFKEIEHNTVNSAALAAKWGRDHIQPLLGKMSPPSPYVACLVADGDYMGKAIDTLKSASKHRDFSEVLASFANATRHIVEQKHMGSLVYSGGDDVLAFLPVPTALACADALRKKFSEIMQGAKLPPDARKPTLSVGIGIGHIMEGMGDLLQLGRDAEKLAKGSDLPEELRRDALAVVLDKRSGGTRQWRAQWSEFDEDPAGRLGADAELLKSRLSTRKVYQIAATRRRLPEPDRIPNDQDGAWADLLRREVERSLKRATTGDGSNLTFDDVGLKLIDALDYCSSHRILGAWIDRMLIARAIADAMPEVKKQRAEVAS